jgi:hypothetical protein
MAERLSAITLRHFIGTIMIIRIIIIVAFCLQCLTTVSAQNNVVGADTVRIHGQSGVVNLVTGDNVRTLHYPSESGTLALVGENDSTCNQCCGDITISGQFLAAAGGNERRYTDIIDTRGMENALQIYLTGNPIFGQVNLQQCILGYETAPDVDGPWYTFVEVPVGRLKQGANFVWQYDPPVFLEVLATGSRGVTIREVGSYIHSGASQQVRIAGAPCIFRYVRGYVRELIIDFTYVMRVY